MITTSRRSLVMGGAGLLGAGALGFPRPAIAENEPIRIGWLAAMTGPSSAPAIGFNRGVVSPPRRSTRLAA